VQRNQQTFQVESVMKEAAVAVPMQTSELLLVQDVGLEQLAKASASMENNLRVRIIALHLSVLCVRGHCMPVIVNMWQVRIAEEKIADEELLADIAMLEDDDGSLALHGHPHAISTDYLLSFLLQETKKTMTRGWDKRSCRSAVLSRSLATGACGRSKGRARWVRWCVCGGNCGQRRLLAAGIAMVMMTDAVSLGCSSACS
jgi:hypothetical protein